MVNEVLNRKITLNVQRTTLNVKLTTLNRLAGQPAAAGLLAVRLAGLLASRPASQPAGQPASWPADEGSFYWKFKGRLFCD